MGDFITTANGLIALLTGLIGLIGTATGAYIAIKCWIKSIKEKNSTEVWALIMNMADTAMKEAEKSGKCGADKKQMVVDAVKAGCNSAGLNIDCFIDQLSAYIDGTIDFVNGMNK